jgi:hypothetical protein
MILLLEDTRLKPGFAIVIAVTGIANLTGADKWLEARVTAMPPDAWVNLTVGL